MNRRPVLLSVLPGLLAALFCSVSALGAETPPNASSYPHIVFIFADDMGYGDIQRYNPYSRIPTPNLNRLVDEGMQFTDAHTSSSVCTPSRYGLLTGRYCWRTRLKRGVLFPPHDKPLIEKQCLTLPAMLRQKGYHTACIGKWHLGIDWARDEKGQVDFNQPFEFGPTDVGFDEFFGIAASLDMIPYMYYRNHEPVHRATETQPRQDFPRFLRRGPKATDFEPPEVLDRLTREAVKVIEKNAGRKNPFFLYFPLTAPHKPTWPAERFTRKTGLGPYGDFIYQVDWTVGQVLEAIDKAGIADNTLVFYSSDNGSYMYRRDPGSPDHVHDPANPGYAPENHRPNGPWRGTKADIWEAGHRVPFIVRWPGKIAPGSQCDTTVCLTDVMASCADIVDFNLPGTAGQDSFSLYPLLQGKDWTRAPVIHHSVAGMFAMRHGKWKMVFGNGSGGREKPRGESFKKPWFLFDMEADPAETTDVIEQYPDIADKMELMLLKIMADGHSRDWEIQ